MRTLLSITLALFFSVAGVDVAASILDQSHDFAPDAEGSIRFDIDRAQTFTVGISGKLTGIDLRVRRFDSSTTSPLEITIQQTSAGIPIDSILASTTVSPASIPFASPFNAPFTSFDFSTANLLVAEGDVLAIVLRSSTQYEWMKDNSGGYAGGAEFIRNPGGGWNTGALNDDFAFRTFVEPVPEASALLMWVALGSIGGATYWRSRSAPSE